MGGTTSTVLSTLAGGGSESQSAPAHSLHSPGSRPDVKGKAETHYKQGEPACRRGRYLYPVLMLSSAFRGKLLEKIKRQLKQGKQLPQYQSLLDILLKKPWVVYCEPPSGNAQPRSFGVKYLGQYTHRVAISKHRIQNIDDSGVSFWYKDYG